MQEKEEVSVAVDDSQPKCALSGEKFEKFWHDQYQVCCAWCMVADINDAWSCFDLLTITMPCGQFIACKLRCSLSLMHLQLFAGVAIQERSASWC